MQSKFMKSLFLLSAIFGLFVFSMVGPVYGFSSYDINIPTGAASPDAPYFWQSEKDGSTTGDITIEIGDEVVWKNADTAAHTVTSGTPTDGPDDMFDSGLFAPGKSFSFIFTEKDEYPYYCLVHPWMTGTVFVIEGFQILPQVGADAGDGLTTFDVEYDFDGLLSNASINEDEKSITFEIVGNAKSDDHNLTLRLPFDLIEGPFVIWVDGEMISEFDYVKENDLGVLNIMLTENSKLITIVGTTVVPEFGVMTMTILGIAIVGILFVGQKKQLSKRL